MIEHDLILQKFAQISFFLSFCWNKPIQVSFWALFKKQWSRWTTRYQAVTLSTHWNLYRQQICAILFLLSPLGAEIILSLGHAWPFFFILKRLYTIKAVAHDATITVGVTAESAVMPCYCSSLYCSCAKYLQSVHDSHVSHLYFLLSPTLKFKL